ncbi:MAG: recombinase family protein [Lachnospiraceae bacterium]|nr:recombinase family protein [Lachnospiraceae bacterium]
MKPLKQAFYLRLSQADGDLGVDNKDESNSIENQRLLLRTFAGSREDLPNEAIEYVDDGYSGTDFNRPGFAKMLEDAKQGKIDIILVKDLSRLGRDYIGVGDYLEQVFPLLGIRFIAVNSNYDSNNYIGKTMGLDMSITNLVNTLYSRDISKKYTSSLQTKWRRGICTAGRLPFGYKKDPEQKEKWVVDPEAAGYVRMVFDKALAGWSTSMIAAYMNEQKIPTPGQYRQLHSGTGCWNRKVTDEEWLWDVPMVLRTLRNYSYTGALVHGKTKKVSVGNKSRRNVRKEDWFVVADIHEGIVTPEEFEEAQAAIRHTDMPPARFDSGFSLKGKIRCGNCNLVMEYHDGVTPIIYCGHAIESGKASKCDKTRHRSQRIEYLVLHSLNHQLLLLGTLAGQLEDKKAKHGAGLTAETKQLKKKIEILQADRIRLYERFADRMISLEEYQTEKTSVAEQLKTVQTQYDRLASLEQKEDSMIAEIEVVQGQAEELMCYGKMTREIAEAFIDTVYIYNAKRVEIVFLFDDLIRRVTEYLEQEAGEEEKI